MPNSANSISRPTSTSCVANPPIIRSPSHQPLIMKPADQTLPPKSNSFAHPSFSASATIPHQPSSTHPTLASAASSSISQKMCLDGSALACTFIIQVFYYAIVLPSPSSSVTSSMSP